MIGFLTRPTGMLTIAVVGIVLAFGLGRWQGYVQGEASFEAKQLKADEDERAEIRERIKNALDEIGRNPTDDDIERVLRKLAGE